MQKRGWFALQSQLFLVTNLFFALSVLKPTLAPYIIYAWYLLTNIRFDFINTTSIFLARPNC